MRTGLCYRSEGAGDFRCYDFRAGSLHSHAVIGVGGVPAS